MLTNYTIPAYYLKIESNHQVGNSPSNSDLLRIPSRISCFHVEIWTFIHFLPHANPLFALSLPPYDSWLYKLSIASSLKSRPGQCRPKYRYNSIIRLESG